jgi:hypothetical protein
LSVCQLFKKNATESIHVLHQLRDCLDHRNPQFHIGPWYESRSVHNMSHGPKTPEK